MGFNTFNPGPTLTPHTAAAQETLKGLDKAYAHRNEQVGHEGACSRAVYAMQRTYAETFARERDLGTSEEDAVSGSINGLIAVVTSVVLREAVKQNASDAGPIVGQLLQALAEGVSVNLANCNDQTVVATAYATPEEPRGRS